MIKTFGSTLHHHLDEVVFIFYVLVRLAFPDAEERGLRDVDVAALDQLLHVGGRKT